MKFYYYIYLIDFLDIPEKLILDENIFLYPNKTTRQRGLQRRRFENQDPFETSRSRSSSLEFHPKANSYLIIRKKLKQVWLILILI